MSDLPNRPGGGKESSAALSILFENYLKVVNLNVFTGEFRMIKTFCDYRDRNAQAAPSFFEYAKNAVCEGEVHKDDSDMFLRYLDSDYLAGRLMGTGGRHIMLHGLRCRIFGEYKSVTMEIIASKNFSREAPWAIMCISCPEKLRSPIGAVLDRAFCKIVHVRLSDGVYEPVYMTDSEISAEESLVPGLRNWFASFARAGNVYDEDRENFLSFIDTENLRRIISENYEAQLTYRRRQNGEYRPVCMKIVPDLSCSPDDPRAFIYIYEKASETSCLTERQAGEKYFGFSDIMTGTRNKSCFDELCREYEASGRKEPVGVLYVRLNFDGEDCESIRESLRIFAILLMETFGRERSFRLGETEFAAVAFGGNGESFRRRAAGFCSGYRQSVNRKVMTGFYRDEAAESIRALMDICMGFAEPNISVSDDDEF